MRKTPTSHAEIDFYNSSNLVFIRIHVQELQPTEAFLYTR